MQTLTIERNLPAFEHCAGPIKDPNKRVPIPEAYLTNVVPFAKDEQAFALIDCAEGNAPVL